MILVEIILLANDIAENPGPENDEVSGFTIFHLNVRSIRNKLSDVEHYIDECDIACFTETHLDASINTDDILIEGFDIPFRKDRTNHGGGVLVYFREGLSVSRRLELENDIDETIWVKVMFQNQSIIIGTVYRPE